MMRSAFFALLALVGVSSAILLLNSYLIERFSQKYLFYDLKRVPKKRVAMILGTTKYVKKGRLNYFYKYRIDAGAKLFKSGKVKKLLLSGNYASKYYNEPLTMKRDLMKLGVPERSIILDNLGVRTFDSIVRANRLFGVDDYILVSQPFHLKRAIFIAHKKGFKAIGFSAKERSFTIAQTKMFLRELLARAKATLDIYILNTEAKSLERKLD